MEKGAWLLVAKESHTGWPRLTSEVRFKVSTMHTCQEMENKLDGRKGCALSGLKLQISPFLTNIHL